MKSRQHIPGFLAIAAWAFVSSHAVASCETPQQPDASRGCCRVEVASPCCCDNSSRGVQTADGADAVAAERPAAASLQPCACSNEAPRAPANSRQPQPDRGTEHNLSASHASPAYGVAGSDQRGGRANDLAHSHAANIPIYQRDCRLRF